ncbi:MAG: filamentous hemagglutinin N-terminal domain-containing protein, partial [Symploca sp. SIO1A3]|nr:filamentous hemagglutinin N-terminal domain-containing protein [Symploca sp. SIO1A3]
MANWQSGFWKLWVATSLAVSGFGNYALAQITPDGTLGNESSVVTPDARVRGRAAQLIEGGAVRNVNLFHSFLEFNVGKGERVYFANPVGIENILTRVTGNNVSEIGGTLGVDGEANLFLLNPNGIIFGEGAELDIRGSFVGSTADSIVFGNGVEFSASESEAAPLLKINVPIGLQYGPNQPAPVVNAGNIEVGQGQSLTLSGGALVSSGELRAPGGQISLAAVPESSLVRLERRQVLGWEQLPTTAGTQTGASALSVAELVEGAGLENAGIPVEVNPGTAIVSGSVDVSNIEGEGGIVQVLGDKVGLIDAKINASGRDGGGMVLIGGDYQGQGTVPNASQTYLSGDSVVNADGLQNGDGGRVIVWADKTASIHGSLTAKGGAVSGNGGLIETSGKQFLNLTSTPDASAPNGSGGTWLIDPTDITIMNGGGAIGTNEVDVANINAALNMGTSVTISTSIGGAEQGNITQNNNAPIRKTAGGDATLSLEAENDIFLNADITSDSGHLNVELLADSDNNSTGNIRIFNARINTNGGDFSGFARENAPSERGVDIGNSNINAEGGDIELRGTGGTVNNNDNNRTGRGIELKNSVLGTTGTGNITLTGNGGTNGNFGIGIDLIENTTVSSENGDIKLIGTGNGINNGWGIQVRDGTLVRTTGTGNVSLTGTSNGTGEGNNGILIRQQVGGGPSVVETIGTGNITLNGISESGTFGLTILENSIIRSQDGNINLMGTGGNNAVNTDGIGIAGNSVVESTGKGSITMIGTGGTGGDAQGIVIGFENARVSSKDGDIILRGTGNGNGATIFGDHGILIFNGGVLESTGAGNIILNGTGGNASDSINAGVFIEGVLKSTGTGNINLEGIGGNEIDENYGILIQGDGRVSAATGNISLTGTGNGTGNDNMGIDIRFGGVVETTNGDINLLGTGAATNGDVNHGIGIFNGGLVRSTGAGSIEMTGTTNATSAGGFGNDGIVIVDNGGVESTGTGMITMTGTAGNGRDGFDGNQGIVVLGLDARVTSVNGDIFLRGTGRGIGNNHYGIWIGSGGDGVVRTTGTGNITLEGITSGISNNSEGILFKDGGVVEAAGTGNISLTADEMTFADNLVEIGGNNLLQLQPLDPTLGITIGGTARDNRLNLDSSELDALQNRFSQIIIGRDNGSGAITVLPATFNNPTTIQAPVTGGTIRTNGVINTNNNPLTLIAGSNVILNNDINTGSGNLRVLGSSITQTSNSLLTNWDAFFNSTSGNVTLNDIVAENLTVNSAGAILGNGILTINRDASFTSILANAGSVSVRNTNPTTVGYSIIGGNFLLNSPFPISQAPGEPLQVAGNISVNGGGNAPLTNTIGLPQALTILGEDVLVTEVGTVNLPTRTVTGNLTVNSLPKAVLAFNSVNDNAAITLNQANSFGGTVRFNTTSDAIFVEGTPGITQSGEQLVGGSATFNAHGGNISLTNPANQFGSLAFAGNEVSLQENDATNLLTSTATSNLNLTSGGIITQTGALNIAGDASFTTTAPNAGNVSLTNRNATILGRSLIGGNLTIDSGRPISQAPTEPLQVAGNTTIVNPIGNPNLDTSGNIVPRL